MKLGTGITSTSLYKHWEKRSSLFIERERNSCQAFDKHSSLVFKRECDKGKKFYNHCLKLADDTEDG